MRRVIALILSIAMVASLATGLAVTSFAAESITVVGGITNTDYTISGNMVTIINDVTLTLIRKESGDLTIYIPTEKTLTVSKTDDDYAYAGTIIPPKEEYHSGYSPIYCGGNITITGGGTLNVIGYGESAASIWALDTRINTPQYLDGDMGNIYIDGCTISVTNIDNNAIMANGNISITDSKITAISKNYAIGAFGKINIDNNSIVNAKGSYPFGAMNGIIVNDETLTSSNVKDYFGTGSEFGYTDGLYAVTGTDWVCCNAGAAEPGEPVGPITINDNIPIENVSIQEHNIEIGSLNVSDDGKTITVDKIYNNNNLVDGNNDLKINIPKGKTLIVSNSNECIRTSEGTITITGGGTLNCIAFNTGTSCIMAGGGWNDQKVKNIIIDGCIVNLTNTNGVGMIASFGQITITNLAEVTVTANMGCISSGVSITIDNSIVTANTNGTGIYGASGISIDNNSTVKSKGIDYFVTQDSEGIRVNGTIISTANVKDYFGTGSEFGYTGGFYVVSGEGWLCCGKGANPSGENNPAKPITINGVDIEVCYDDYGASSITTSSDSSTVTVDRIGSSNHVTINIPEGKTLIVSRTDGPAVDISTYDGSLTITGGGTLKAISENGDGMQIVSNITIEDGCTVYAHGSGSTKAGIYSFGGTITIKDNSIVTAILGIYAGWDVVIEDGSIVTVDSDSAAIDCEGHIKVSSEAQLKVRGICAFKAKYGVFVNETPVSSTDVNEYFYNINRKHDITYSYYTDDSFSFYYLTATDAADYVCSGNRVLPAADASKITYEITSYDPKEVMVTGYDGDMPEGCSLTIPKMVNISGEDYTVTSIDESAFDECTELASIEIPNSVISIGDYAFNFCSALTDVTIPSSVQNIGFIAFAMCSSLENINVDATNTVYTSIDGVLYSKDKTELICYPAGKSAKSFEVSNSVTKIDEYAFAFCSALTDITIPSSINNIGYLAFGVCTGLENIGVNVANTVYASIDGILYSKDGKELICYPAGKKATSFEVSNSVNIIDDYAFAYNSALIDVTIGENVTSIGESAFAICSALTSVTIGDNVKTIGKKAFTECTGLTSIEIPEGVTSIGEYAFNNCSSLTSVTVKAATPPTLGKNAFNYCSNLTSIYVPALSVGAYKAATNWSSKKDLIKEMPAEPGIETIITFSGNVITADSDIYYCQDASTFKNESDATTNGSTSLTLTKGYMYTLKVSDTVFYVNYVVKEITIQANPDELAKDLTDARELINKVVTKTNKYLTTDLPSGNVYTTEQAYNTFNDAIAVAETNNNNSKTQLEIDKALVDLNGTLRTFISTLRADTWYLSGNEVTRTDISDTDVFTESYAVLNTVTDATIYNSVKSTLLIKVGEKYSYSTSYVVYANVDDETAYSEYEKSQQIPHSPTDNPQPIDPPSPQPEVKPITIEYSNGKFDIVEIDLFDVRGIYYGYGSKGDLSKTDYFGLNGFSECYALGNGTHTFKVLATNKSTGETKLYEDIEYTVTGLTDPVAVNQNGVVFINFENTPSKIYYEKGGKTIYVPIEKGLKLDADNFTEVTEITFDTTPVEIKVYSGKEN